MKSLEQFKSEQADYEERKRKLAELLASHNIPLDQWGKGEAKTLDHLLKELTEDVISLDVDENGELMRFGKGTLISISYTDESGKNYELIEEKQVFKDGRERRRDLGASLGETSKPEESPEDTARRAIKEELGIGGASVSFDRYEERLESSASYPGLKTQKRIYHFKAILNKDQFKSEGYLEEEEDKTTYFKWVEV